MVVGAGHNGLVAANLLTDAGWDVLVLEAGGEPGGAVRTAEVAAPGYLSDLYSAFYPFGAASPVLAGLRLDRYGLTWRHAPDVLAHLLPDGRAAVLGRVPRRTATSVDEFAAGDGERWLSGYREWQEIGPDLLAALFTPFPPVRAGTAVARRLRVAGTMRLARRFLLPMRVLGEEMFRGEGARLLMAGCALHTDLPPEEAGSGLYGWLLAMVGQQYGFPVPVGGAGRLTDALVARLRAGGGRIAYRARVEHIGVTGGRATSVSTVDGRRFGARRAVVADVPAPALYLDLVGPAELPPRLVEDLRYFRWDGATVKVDWALAGPVPWKNDAVRGAGTVHLGADIDGLTRYSAALATGAVPAEPLLVTGQMTTSDPARSPAGTESFWAYTHLPQRRSWPAGQAADLAAGTAARMEAIVEEQAPGFGRLVVGRHLAGPADLQQGNPSLVGGAVGGGTAAAYQQLFLRPVPGLGRADTPVDRLFLASASAHPGGGVHGAPGANAARAALTRDRRIAGRVYAAGIRAAHRAIYRVDRPRPASA